MDDREFERKLERLLSAGLSAGTEEFRDALLARCLSALDAGCDVIELRDADLGLLAAAGVNPADGGVFCADAKIDG